MARVRAGADRTAGVGRALRRCQGLAVGRLGDHWHTPGAGAGQGLVVGYGTPRERLYPQALDVLEKVLDGE